MKHIVTLLLFAAPFVINAQEPPANAKKSNTPPSNEKSITEKGVSSTKSRGISVKTSTDSPAPAAKEATPAVISNTTATNEDPKK